MTRRESKIKWNDRPAAQQTAIRDYYRKAKAGTLPRPKNRKVLNDTVQMTPRRQEILWHVAYSDGIKWIPLPDWVNRWSNAHVWKAHLGGVDISQTLITLRKMRLVTWGPRTLEAFDTTRTPELRITVKGMAAALEYVSSPLDTSLNRA